MRVCLDTNVFVAAFANRGLCSDVLRTVLEDHELVIGDVPFEKLDRLLRTKLRLTGAQIAAVRAALATSDAVPRPRLPSDLGGVDPDDAWAVVTAVAGRADVLVAGDAGLLAAARGAPLPIPSPRGFWAWLRGGGAGGWLLGGRGVGQGAARPPWGVVPGRAPAPTAVAHVRHDAASASRAPVVPSTMPSPSTGLGWDVRRLREGARLGELLLHAMRCARDPDRGPWTAHLVRTRWAETAEGPAHVRLRREPPGPERDALVVDAEVGPEARGPDRRFVPAPGAPRRPVLAAGPPAARAAFDPTRELAHLIANAEAAGIAVTWCAVDVTIGGFVYHPPQRTARRRDPREAPRELDARELARVTIGDLVVVLNPAQGWITTFEVMLHELAHALLGHLGRAPSVRQASDLIAVRTQPPPDTREFEAHAAAYVAAFRRGDRGRREGHSMLLRFARLERDGALETVDLLEIFRVAEILAAWCRIRPQAVGVRAARDRRPWGPPFGAGRTAAQPEEGDPAVRERELMPA